jgi:hypothetical protein
MAFLKGKDGIVRVGANDVMHVQSWNLDPQAEVVQGWGMGDEWKTSFTGVKSYSGSFEVYDDPADPAQIALVLGAEITVEFYPGGDALGSAYFQGSVVITGTPRSGSKDGIPTLTYNFTGSGALVPLTVTV